MRKLFLGIVAALAAFVFSVPAYGQCSSYTTVTGTITDPNSIPYANGTITADLFSSGGTPTCAPASGGTRPQFATHVGPTPLDVSGSFTMQLPPQSIITNGDTGWTFTVAISPGGILPLGTGPQSFQVKITISGASQSVSATLSAAAPSLSNISGGGGGGSPVKVNNVLVSNPNFQNSPSLTYNVSGSNIQASTGFLMQGANMTIVNGNFELPNFATTEAVPPLGWSDLGVNGGTQAFDTTTFPANTTFSYKQNCLAGTSCASFNAAFTSIVPGQVYTATASAKSDGTAPAAICIVGEQGGGSVINDTASCAFTLSTSWTTVTVQFTAQTGQDYAVVAVADTNNTSNIDGHVVPGSMWFQNVQSYTNNIVGPLFTTAGYNYFSDVGAANTYAVNTSPAFALTTGMVVNFLAANANTTTSTFNLNAGGAVAIKKNGNASNLVANDIKAGQIVTVMYDGTQWEIQSTLGNASAASGLADPGANGVINRTALNTTAPANFHNMALPLICLDSSGSGTAQVCTTSPSFTPSAGDSIIYKTTTTNTGDLTINVNATSAIHARKWQANSMLASGDMVAGVYVELTYDGTYWETYTIGNPPSGTPGGSQHAVQFNNGGGSFGGVNSPSANGDYGCEFHVTGAAVVDPTCPQVGLGGRSLTGAATTDTVLFSDNMTVINHDQGASFSITETLGTPASLGNTAFAYRYSNHQPTATDTITCSGCTIQYGILTAASSINVQPGISCLLKVNPNSTGNYTADCTGANTVDAGSGTAAMGTSAIASAACATVVSVSATGVLTTDTIQATFNGDPTAVTGYIPSTSGMLTIIDYPTANHVNFKVCNNTGSSITPGAVSLNWLVTR